MIKTIFFTPALSAAIVAVIGILTSAIHFEIYSILMACFVVVSWGYVLVILLLLPLYGFGLRGAHFLATGSGVIYIGVMLMYYVSPDSHFHLMAKEDPLLYFQTIRKEIYYAGFSGVILTAVFYLLASHNKSLEPTAASSA